jgi:hypothetical protein
MAAGIMHRFAMKFHSMIGWMLATRGHRTVVALAIVEAMIDVSIEMSRSMKPRPCADEYTAAEPFRSVVAVWSAIVRRNLIVPVGTNGRSPNADCHLCLCAIRSRHEKTKTNRQNANAF